MEHQIQQKSVICHLEHFPIPWTQIQFTDQSTTLRMHTCVLKSIPKIDPEIYPKIDPKRVPKIDSEINPEIEFKLVLRDRSQAHSPERSQECSGNRSLEQSQSWEDQAPRTFSSVF